MYNVCPASILSFILTCPTVFTVTKFDTSFSYPHSKHSSYQPSVSRWIKRSPLHRGQLFNFQIANYINLHVWNDVPLYFQKVERQRFIMDHFWWLCKWLNSNAWYGNSVLFYFGSINAYVQHSHSKFCNRLGYWWLVRVFWPSIHWISWFKLCRLLKPINHVVADKLDIYWITYGITRYEWSSRR